MWVKVIHWQPDEQVSGAQCLTESFALASGVVAASFTKSLHHTEDRSGVGEMGSDLQAGEDRMRWEMWRGFGTDLGKACAHAPGAENLSPHSLLFGIILSLLD